jgi:hypothetical protein
LGEIGSSVLKEELSEVAKEVGRVKKKIKDLENHIAVF